MPFERQDRGAERDFLGDVTGTGGVGHAAGRCKRLVRRGAPPAEEFAGAFRNLNTAAWPPRCRTRTWSRTVHSSRTTAGRRSPMNAHGGLTRRRSLAALSGPLPYFASLCASWMPSTSRVTVRQGAATRRVRGDRDVGTICGSALPGRMVDCWTGVVDA